MSRYVDIGALTEAVLASVKQESAVKTASVETKEALKTEIGQALKSAGVRLREHCGDTVTYTDLNDIIDSIKIADGLGRAAGSVGGGAAGALGGAATGALAGSILGPPGALVGGAVGAGLGALRGAPAGAVLVGGQKRQAAPPQQVQNAAAPTAKVGSALGSQLRKIAQTVREQGEQNKEARLSKAAQMLTAAVGLEHLTEGLK